MKHTIIHVGLDVDDTKYHGSALDKSTGEVIDFKCRPTLKGLLDKLGQYFPDCILKLCYEASYIGFTLQRDLACCRAEGIAARFVSGYQKGNLQSERRDLH
ncbi:MAG: transglutaminase-like domain-containing protein, partial [Acidiferrobacterales bacterium]|nr:transglutaminase-like domain-containing protein [Acidiferrobacterales bacterium]